MLMPNLAAIWTSVMEYHQIRRKASGGAAIQKLSPEARSSAVKEKSFAVARPASNLSPPMKAPSGVVLWRAGDGGRIERSTDGGKTWASEISPSQEDWLAGVAISDTVCWLAGRNGAMARTMDGSHWQPVAPPPQAARADGKLPDWTSITAGDAQSATIAASDGRKFATADGGRTWRQQ